MASADSATNDAWGPRLDESLCSRLAGPGAGWILTTVPERPETTVASAGQAPAARDPAVRAELRLLRQEAPDVINAHLCARLERLSGVPVA